jgi:hypothetical protein
MKRKEKKRLVKFINDARLKGVSSFKMLTTSNELIISGRNFKNFELKTRIKYN